ncbi:LysR family transcriptional regulator [Pseudomonas sp. PH1b]|uniref:LysR family transcriptional regulator n=1 Tax=Pseudomonas sp. PH1b TaxID=1397282 RepID=UPI00046A60F8|nr:LysR family transcriptional regulator [Pseudomonas sp. PH1b]BFD41371.1 LysR family transcriptional regulator [Pseudomonas sp. FFPRI_1]
MSDLIDLKRVRHLVYLSEELHFSRAAARANLSQTAFSRSIQSLEADLGVRLFDRDTRTVILTAAGQQLIGRAHELLGCARKLVAQASDIAGAEGGELSFGISPMASTLNTVEMLIGLRKKIPRLVLNVQVGYWDQLCHLLETEQLDFVVASIKAGQEFDPRFSIIHLPSQPASVFCRCDHPLARQDGPIQRAQILDYQWSGVVPSNEASVYALFDLPPGTLLPWSLSSNDLNLLRETTLSSDSLLLTWRSWLDRDLREGLLVDLMPRIQPPWPAELLTINNALMAHAGRTLSPIAQQAVDMIVAGVAPPASASG